MANKEINPIKLKKRTKKILADVLENRKTLEETHWNTMRDWRDGKTGVLIHKTKADPMRQS